MYYTLTVFSFVYYRNVIDVVDDTMLVFDPKESSDDFFFHGQRQQRRDLNKKVNRDQKFAFDTVYGPNSTNGDIFEGMYTNTYYNELLVVSLNMFL